MAEPTRQPPPPAPRANPLHGDQGATSVTASKSVTLSHMPPRPEDPVVEETSGKPLHPSVAAEQEAGRAAIEQAQKRLKAEQEYGARMSQAR